VSLFVLSPEIEDRDKIEAATSTTRPSTLNDISYYFIFKRITKKIGDEPFFLCNYSNLYFSNFKAPLIPTSLVAILLVLEGSIIKIIVY
jgi:hypothetical protein